MLHCVPTTLLSAQILELQVITEFFELSRETRADV